MLFDYVASALVTLLVTLDPPALAPIFISLTRGMTGGERKRVALRAAIIAFCILAFFGLGGEVLLRLLGVGIPAFRISGGLLLFWIAFEMVFERRNERKQHTADVAITEDHIRNVAAFPLAIPLMAGPGAITATILLAGRANGAPLYLAGLIALIALGVATCFAVFMAAERVSRMLGVTGNVVLSRLLGVILAGLAVQFIINGVQALAAAGMISMATPDISTTRPMAVTTGFSAEMATIRSMAMPTACSSTPPAGTITSPVNSAAAPAAIGSCSTTATAESSPPTSRARTVTTPSMTGST